ncbi:hypothetical protein MKA31_10325 [[Clostridium] innocuum]|uniref:hypothetical protein n=1 Tax=Clostridium innocuum TaxID=1522 RepID=UPI0021490EF1|nr:hypothetical protein [[Clostridium] innocuum]MCR0272484.1 hypothetical protein [[Clostridium] innocuum]
MKYHSFILKKIEKNWLNLIPFVLVTAFIIFIYVNYRISAFTDINDPEYSGINEIERIKKDIPTFQSEIAKFDETSEDYKISKENLNMAENRLKYLQQKVDAVTNNNWTEYYKNNLELTNITMAVVLEDIEYYDEDMVEVLKLDQNYAKYMIENKLSFDDRFKPSQGISYTVKIMNDIFPFILSILLIYIMSSVYCSTIIENMDIQKLIPISKFKKQGIRLLTGAFIGGFITIFIVIVSSLCGALGNVLGSLQTPVLTYSQQGVETYTSLSSVLPQFLILLLLSIFFIVNFVSVISILARKNMKCLLISLVIIIGCILITSEIVPIRPILHILPTTYINAFKVVTGELCYITNNSYINILYGILSLTISNIILFILYYYLPKLSRGVATR